MFYPLGLAKRPHVDHSPKYAHKQHTGAKCTDQAEIGQHSRSMLRFVVDSSFEKVCARFVV